MTPTIQSLARGLKILDILGASGEPLLLGDIASRFTIDRSSVFRLVSTLVKCGYVIQDPGTKRYRLGYRVLALAGAAGGPSRLDELARPVMEDIVGATGQNTHLAVRDGADVVFIAVNQPTTAVSLNIAVGTREPAAVTALGKALIAFMPGDARRTLLARIDYPAYTEKSPAGAEALECDLETVRRARLAVDEEAYRVGVTCLAAPVFDHMGQVCYAIGISGLSAAIAPHIDRYRDLVRDAGARLSTRLGHKADAPLQSG